MFEKMTGAVATDCIINENGVVFIVREGDVGRAIGKNGSTINRIRSAFGKQVNVVENAPDLEAFIINIFSSIEILNVDVKGQDKPTAIVRINAKDRGSAIGRNGDRIKMARMLVQRHFDADIKLITEG